MTLTVTELKQKIFSEIDKVIATGQPIENERKGHRLKIILEEKKSKLSSLSRKDDVVACSDYELIYNNWVKEWRHNKNND